MVLRKQPPPRLDYPGRELGRFDPHPSISPTAKSTSPASPKRLTRPKRAQSSPQPRRLPSPESVYSPDLNTSPAFDLMSLEQAQRSPVTPVGTASSDPQNPWADELVEHPDQHRENSAPGSTPLNHDGFQEGTVTDKTKGDRVPSIVRTGTQRRLAANELQPDHAVDDADDWDEWERDSHTPIQLQSNNPFLKTKQSDHNPWQDGSQNQEGGQVRDTRTTSYGSDALSQSEGYIPMTARLSLLDQPPAGSPWEEERPAQPQQSQNHHLAPGLGSQAPQPDNQVPYLAYGQGDDLHPGREASQNDYPPHYTELPYDHGRLSTPNEINTPSATNSTTTTQSSHVLVDVGDYPKPEDETAPRAASSVYESDINEARGTHAGFPTTAPPLPKRANAPESNGDAGLVQHLEQSSTGAPTGTSRQTEQRAETYAIRHINWTDTTGKLRQSPMLAQNENGPCPLLALVNALVLRAAEDAQIPIVKALQEREQISLGLLIQALFEELITRLGPDDEFPDIEALSRFLTMLDTGMNVNPRLTLESEDDVGRFYQTSDIKFYSTFDIPLIHGWVANPATETHAALMRVAQYHEDIQLLHFRKEELESSVFRGGSLSFEEEQTMNDIQTIQQFAEVDNATQLSPFGLDQLKTQLAPGSVSILFRNDHFSTLYKHPQSHKLYSLVTDAGYASHAEIVWESLVDVDGSRAEFFAGDFRAVSHGPPAGSGPSSHDTGHSASQSDEPSQEQSDADYAYALSLQFQEEEQRTNSGNGQARDNRRASAPGQGIRTSPPDPRSHSRTNGGQQSAAERRLARQSQPVGRTSHEGDDLAPPPYEQAASGRLLQSPQRSSSSVNPSPSFDNRYQRNNYGRRPAATSVSSGLPPRPKDKSKDCVVM